jgi:hypothetical protein
MFKNSLGFLFISFFIIINTDSFGQIRKDFCRPYKGGIIVYDTLVHVEDRVSLRNKYFQRGGGKYTLDSLRHFTTQDSKLWKWFFPKHSNCVALVNYDSRFDFKENFGGNHDRNFINARFNDPIDYTYSYINSLLVFSNSQFLNTVTFMYSKFRKRAFFQNSIFNQNADFGGVDFENNKDSIYNDNDFSNIIVIGDALFGNCLFKKTANFSNSRFKQKVVFAETRFEDYAWFEGVEFGTVLDFRGTTFYKPVDFRLANLDSVRTIYLENIKFPIGELYINWDQFKGSNSSYRIQIKKYNDTQYKSPKDSLNELSQSLTSLYELLRNNFRKQGDYSSADDVMYELAERQQKINGDIWGWLYGCLLGWGYRPLHFLFTLVGFMFIFASIILFCPKFYNEIDKSSKNGYWLKRVWYSLIYSASFLLYPRFNAEWLKYDKKFIWFATIEWLIGLSLYIYFIWGIKSHEFDFIRALIR